MKKLYQSRRKREHSRQRNAYEESERVRFHRLQRHKRRSREGIPQPAPIIRDQVTLTAPRQFSLIRNPTEMTGFLRRVAQESRRGARVFIDLSGIEELTSDAIAVLLAWISGDRHPVAVGGFAPQDPRLRAILSRSGFYRHTASHPGVEDTSELQGGIHKRGAYKVDPELADRLVRKVTKGLFGKERRSLASYGTLIECMMNTHQHAARHSKNKERWWVTAFYEEATGRAFFTFVDLGVGILDSIKVTPLKRFFQSNTVLLQEILDGKIPSSTGEKFRGKGLPKINHFVAQDRIRNLVIVSNNVFANITERTFEILDPPFEGTLLNWEMWETVGGDSKSTES